MIVNTGILRVIPGLHSDAINKSQKYQELNRVHVITRLFTV